MTRSRPTHRYAVSRPTHRSAVKYAALLVLMAMAIAVGGMACVDTIESIDRSDETFGAT
jgi:hypothetical protein